MSNIINLECRQLDSDSVVTNGDWSTILSKPVILNEGDTLAINKVFIDTVADTNNQIVIPNDILASIQFYLYVTSIQQQNIALGSDGKDYYSHPDAPGSVADIDGDDYILCVDIDPTIPEANMMLVTKISIRSKVKDGTRGMGDKTGKNPCYLSYFDDIGAISTFYFDVPYLAHVKPFGTTVEITVSVIMDVSKGFTIVSDEPAQFASQNVSSELKNFKIIASQTPSVNYLHPKLVNHQINIPKGTYTSDEMTSLLNNSFQDNTIPDFGQTSLSPLTFPINQLLSTIEGIADSKLASVKCTNTTGRIIIPSGTVNFYVGSNNISVGYDQASKRFFFDSLHFPIYDQSSSGAVAVTYQTDGQTTNSFFAGKVGGAYIHTWSCVNNDPELSNYNTYFDFWNDKLGFNMVDVAAKHQMATDVMTYNGVDVQVPVFRNAQNGVSTTTAKPILDDLIKKGPNKNSYEFTSPANIYSTSDLTTPVVASFAKLDALELEYGYYLIEINNGLSSELIGATDINHTISCIVNRYYSLGTFTSGDISGSLSYTHKGLPLFLKNFNIRVLDSEKNLAQNLEADNSIFISIIRAPQN